MPHSFGLRARTRHMFSRNFREHGAIPLSTYLKTYKVGDIVDIKANAAVQKGMPHKFYHGRTGVVYNVTKSAVGVIIYKKVGSRFMEKRVNLRIEHVKHSKCRQEFLDRVKENAQKKIDARAAGIKVNLKRIPVQPRTARHVSTADNIPQTITAIPYETLFLTNEPSLVPEGEDDLQVQKWLKELDNAEQLMDQLEAKTEKLDAQMDALLSSLKDMKQPNPTEDATTEQQNDKQ